MILVKNGGITIPLLVAQLKGLKRFGIGVDEPEMSDAEFYQPYI